MSELSVGWCKNKSWIRPKGNTRKNSVTFLFLLVIFPTLLFSHGSIKDGNTDKNHLQTSYVWNQQTRQGDKYIPDVTAKLSKY